jgi:DNA-nicking Smr family endonuclease
MKTRDANDKMQDDSEMFDRAMCGVKRLRHKQAVSSRVQDTQIPSLSESSSSEIGSEFGEELRYLRPGIQLSTLQKLRRGHFPIDATLDLHGLNSVDASSRLQEFLRESQSLGRSAVRIVHGKGLGSIGRQPVLKSRVRQLLQENSFVLAFCSASPRNGGTGAVNVLLRKSRNVR